MCKMRAVITSSILLVLITRNAVDGMWPSPYPVEPNSGNPSTNANNGQNNGPPPQGCGPPPEIPNTTIFAKTTSRGSIVLYKCHDGSDQAHSSCRQDNTWTKTTINCAHPTNTLIQQAAADPSYRPPPTYSQNAQYQAMMEHARAFMGIQPPFPDMYGPPPQMSGPPPSMSGPPPSMSGQTPPTGMEPNQQQYNNGAPQSNNNSNGGAGSVPISPPSGSGTQQGSSGSAGSSGGSSGQTTGTGSSPPMQPNGTQSYPGSSTSYKPLNRDQFFPQDPTMYGYVIDGISKPSKQNNNQNNANGQSVQPPQPSYQNNQQAPASSSHGSLPPAPQKTSVPWAPTGNIYPPYPSGPVYPGSAPKPEPTPTVQEPWQPHQRNPQLYPGLTTGTKPPHQNTAKTPGYNNQGSHAPNQQNGQSFQPPTGNFYPSDHISPGSQHTHGPPPPAQGPQGSGPQIYPGSKGPNDPMAYSQYLPPMIGGPMSNPMFDMAKQYANLKNPNGQPMQPTQPSNQNNQQSQGSSTQGSLPPVPQQTSDPWAPTGNIYPHHPSGPGYPGSALPHGPMHAPVPNGNNNHAPNMGPSPDQMMKQYQEMIKQQQFQLQQQQQQLQKQQQLLEMQQLQRQKHMDQHHRIQHPSFPGALSPSSNMHSGTQHYPQHQPPTPPAPPTPTQSSSGNLQALEQRLNQFENTALLQLSANPPPTPAQSEAIMREYSALQAAYLKAKSGISSNGAPGTPPNNGMTQPSSQLYPFDMSQPNMGTQNSAFDLSQMTGSTNTAVDGPVAPPTEQSILQKISALEQQAFKIKNPTDAQMTSIANQYNQLQMQLEIAQNMPASDLQNLAGLPGMSGMPGTTMAPGMSGTTPTARQLAENLETMVERREEMMRRRQEAQALATMMSALTGSKGPLGPTMGGGSGTGNNMNNNGMPGIPGMADIAAMLGIPSTSQTSMPNGYAPTGAGIDQQMQQFLQSLQQPSGAMSRPLGAR